MFKRLFELLGFGKGKEVNSFEVVKSLKKDGLTIKEIAQKLNLTESQVKYRLYTNRRI